MCAVAESSILICESLALGCGLLDIGS
jgi:hypothetical protein